MRLRQVAKRCSYLVAAGSAIPAIHFCRTGFAAPNEPSVQVDPAIVGRFEDLTTNLGTLDWDAEYPQLQRAIQNVWRRNNWTDESDRFALDLACRLSTIPPWKPLERLHVFCTQVEARYGLTGEDRFRFRMILTREATRFLVLHARPLVDVTRDWLETRVEKRPFTPEQVARWTEEGQALTRHISDAARRIAKNLEPLLDADHKPILRSDLKSMHKRQVMIEVMAERWMEGEWEPAEWGMEDDPILQSYVSPRKTGTDPRELAPDSLPPRAAVQRQTKSTPVPCDPSTWRAYVAAFENRFALDPGQRSAADSIHGELVVRAEQYMKTHAQELAAVGQAQPGMDAAYEPVCNLYEELIHRLDAIPTTSQREQAKE